jgi:quercetin dioxygenase-like cupin family protein
MKNYRASFEGIDWQQTPQGARFKLCETDGGPARLLEFGPDLAHPEWCERGHRGIVLEGELRIEFENGADAIYHPGDLIHIPAGKADRHRPSALSELVRVLFWEETGSSI